MTAYADMLRELAAHFPSEDDRGLMLASRRQEAEAREDLMRAEELAAEGCDNADRTFDMWAEDAAFRDHSDAVQAVLHAAVRWNGNGTYLENVAALQKAVNVLRARFIQDRRPAYDDAARAERL